MGVRAPHALLGFFGGNERAVEEPAAFKVAQDHLRISLIRQAGLVVKCSIVERHYRIRIKDAALSIYESEEILFLEDSAGVSVQIYFPFCWTTFPAPGFCRRRFYDHLPRQGRCTALLVIAQFAMQHFHSVVPGRRGILDAPALRLILRQFLAA